jgi:glycosyltransferase involved in cell wall biosynthesis
MIAQQVIIDQADADDGSSSTDRPILRVCHLAKYYPPAAGGIETHVRTLAQAQASLGAEVQVLCVNHVALKGRHGRSLGRATTNTVEDWDGNVRVTRLGRRASVSRWDLCPGIRRELCNLIDNVDVLHLHVPNITMLLPLTTVESTIPLVITYHSDIVRQRLLYKGFRPFEDAVFRRASYILATSRAYIAGSATLKRHIDKVEVLPFAIDLAPFQRPTSDALAFARRLSLEHGAPLWLAVGRLVYYKGLDVAIEALAKVPGKLLLVGSGPLDKHLHDQAKRLGIIDRIIWRARLSDEELVGAYHAATALWFPSNARSEAFGLVQVEAMASGCPVINTNIAGSGVAWVSPHNETGLTIPVNDANALANAACQLWQDGELRRRLAKSGQERATSRFGHVIMARHSLDMYRHTIQCMPRETVLSQPAA